MRRTLSPSAEPNGQQVAFAIDTSTLPADRYVMRVFVQPSGVTTRLVERDIPFGIVKPR
jgi:hypothetical protein